MLDGKVTTICHGKDGVVLGGREASATRQVQCSGASSGPSASIDHGHHLDWAPRRASETATATPLASEALYFLVTADFDNHDQKQDLGSKKHHISVDSLADAVYRLGVVAWLDPPPPGGGLGERWDCLPDQATHIRPPFGDTSTEEKRKR